MRVLLLRLALVLAVVAPTWPLRADVVEHAERLLVRGRYDEAVTLLAPQCERALPRALALTGRVHRLRGERAPMEARFRQLIALSNQGAISPGDSDGAWALAEAQAGLGATRDANVSFARALEAHPERADIAVAWAALLIEKHTLAEARTRLARVLAREPDQPHALALSARIELARGASFSTVEALLARALAIDPALTAAHVTRAGIALRDEELRAADQHIDEALAINPRDLEALSVRAAVRFVADDASGFASAVTRVRRENPSFSGLYSIVATYAEWEHRYLELVQLADAALQIDPNDARAHASRGINLLRTGREAEGLAALSAAAQRDEYDEQVSNLLRLYEGPIATDYLQREEPPFRLRLPKAEAALLVPYLSPLLARAHETMTARYGFSPSVPTDVELYASPAHFAIRATGLPRLGVQGICFGNVVLALSPRAGEFNWGQTLWHEQAHVFHVQHSRGRVPRWFTEGLAEYETSLERPEWRREDDRLLYDALRDDTLPHLDGLNRAFTHATRAEEMTLAYYASTRALAYLVERFGFAAMGRMLTLWGEGLATTDVLVRGVGVSLAEIDRDFRASERARLAPRYDDDLRIDLAAYRDLPRLRQRSAAPGATLDDHAALALGLAEAGEYQVARSRAEAILAETPTHALAHFTLAQVGLKTGDLFGARLELEALRAAGHDGYQMCMLRAQIALARAEPDAAMSALEAAAARDPERVDAHVILARLAKERGDVVREEHALTRVVAIDQHARGPALRLLSLLRARGAYPELRAQAESALYRDVHAPAVHLALADALMHTGRRTGARVEARRARALSPPAEREEVDALLRRIEEAPRARPKASPRIAAGAADSR